jgi:hypothetical protein
LLRQVSYFAVGSEEEFCVDKSPVAWFCTASSISLAELVRRCAFYEFLSTVLRLTFFLILVNEFGIFHVFRIVFSTQLDVVVAV